MQPLIIFIVFMVFSAIRSAAESQNKKKTQGPGAPSVGRPRQPTNGTFRPQVGSAPAQPAQPVPVRRNTRNLFQEPRDRDKSPAAETLAPPLQEEAPPLQVEVVPVAQQPALASARFLQNKEEVLRGVIYAELLAPPKALKGRTQKHKALR